MNPGRRRSSVVADIVVPDCLLQSRRTYSIVPPEIHDRGADNGPVQDAIRAHLENVRQFDLGRARVGSVMNVIHSPSNAQFDHKPRQGSHLPATAEHVHFAPVNFEPDEDRPHPRGSAQRQSAQGEPALPSPTFRDDARKHSVAPQSLFQALSSYSMSGSDASSSGQASSSSSSDSATDGAKTPTTPVRPSVSYAPEPERKPRSKSFAHAAVGRARRLSHAVRRSSMWDVYEKAKTRGAEIQRKKWAMVMFEYGFYVFLLAFVYLLIIGMPLWRGSVWWLYWLMQHKFGLTAGFTIPIGVAAFYAYLPLFILFEDDPPPFDPEAPRDMDDESIKNTALLIPCYKSASLIGATLEASLKIFPASHIFVLANGNSPTPLDNTEEVCEPYGVNHIWSPIGCKLVAQFVGCYAAKDFKYVLMIDDDCKLPPNFPVVSDRLNDSVKSIGYTIKSTGPNSSRGTLCQQAQDLEYKISGLQRLMAGFMGSATFPHGAISLWDREFLVSVFYDHPGFNVSEDWFFGDSCRKLGGRIKMCSSVFVETETPDAIFKSSGSERGGFGEMTVFKQRFMRWNFFFVNGMYYNMAYIFRSWRLGWWEIGAKLFVFQEAYETLLYLLAPFVLPVSALIRAQFLGILTAVTLAIYLVNVIIFNEVHLRRKNERVGWKVLLLYYMPYKMILAFVNVGSCYWSIFKYARYFAKRHLKVVEDEKAVEVILRLEEEEGEAAATEKRLADARLSGRRMTVTAVSARTSINTGKARGQSIYTVGTSRNMSIVPTGSSIPNSPAFMSSPKFGSDQFPKHTGGPRPSVSFMLPLHNSSAHGGEVPGFKSPNW